MTDFDPLEIDWSFVLNLKEFKDYILLNDKLELSQLSRACRSKLKSCLFTIIKLGQKPGDLKLFNKDIDKGELNLDHVKENFKNELPQINLYVNDLSIHRSFNIYKLLPISETFANLNTISIFKLSIPVKVMAESIGNMKNLQTLRLDQVTLVQFQNDYTIEHLLKLSDTIHHLILKDCYVIESKLLADPLRLAYNYEREALSKESFHMMDKEFPNLRSYTIIGYKAAICQILVDFLTKNTSINRLTLSSNLLTQQSLNFIAELTNIKDLTIEDMGLDTSLNVPKFPYLKSFQLYFYNSRFNWKAIEFYNSMSNLTSLTMNYYSYFDEVFTNILAHSPNLRKLVIWNNLQLKIESIPNNQLKYLNLKNCMNNRLHSQIFINSPKLERLVIDKCGKKWYLRRKRSTTNITNSRAIYDTLNYHDFDDTFYIDRTGINRSSMMVFDDLIHKHFFIDISSK